MRQTLNGKVDSLPLTMGLQLEIGRVDVGEPPLPPTDGHQALFGQDRPLYITFETNIYIFIIFLNVVLFLFSIVLPYIAFVLRSSQTLFVF